MAWNGLLARNRISGVSADGTNDRELGPFHDRALEVGHSDDRFIPTRFDVAGNSQNKHGDNKASRRTRCGLPFRHFLVVMMVFAAIAALMLAAKAFPSALKIDLGGRRSSGGKFEVETPPEKTLPPVNHHGRIRVALCFFGLSRSLRWTLPSIQSRVFDVLQARRVVYDVFVHTYNTREVNNERAGEVHVRYAQFAEDYKLLPATRTLVTDQDDLDLAFPNPIELTHYKWKYYREGTAPETIRNVFRAYMSMMEVWGVMAEYALEEGVTYDGVVILRPDVWFHLDIDLPYRSFPLSERTIFMPSFETDVKPGGRKNDRFGYGSITAMRVLMHRIDTFFEHDVGHYTNSDLDSEWLLGHHLRKHNISVSTIHYPVTRIRMDGKIPKYDHHRVTAACHGGYDSMACEMMKLGFKFPVHPKEQREEEASTSGNG